MKIPSQAGIHKGVNKPDFQICIYYMLLDIFMIILSSNLLKNPPIIDWLIYDFF